VSCREPFLSVLFRKVLLLTFLLLCYYSAPLIAQEGEKKYSVQQDLFLPPVYYIGDEVELRLILSLSTSAPLSVPESLPSTRYIHIRQMLLSDQENNGVEVRVRFVSFKTGSSELPPVDLGGVLLKGISINTTSLLKGEELDKDFRDLKGQLFIPGTALGTTLIISALIGVPLLVIVGGARIRKEVRRFLLHRRRRQPYRRLLSALAILEGEEMEHRDFYIRLTRMVRHYLNSRTGTDYLTRTINEIKWEKQAETGEENPIEQYFLPLLEYGDLIKFGEYKASMERRREDLSMVRKASETLEELLEKEAAENEL